MKNILALLLIFCLSKLQAQTITLTYDPSGNRLTKQIVSNIPVASISGDSVACVGDIAQLRASGGGNYQWNTGETQATISVIDTGTTEHTVIVSGSSNCKDTAAFLLNVIALPVVTGIVGDSLVNQNETITYTVSSVANVNYNWSVTNGIIISGNGTHSIQVQWNGCCTATLSVSPTVNDAGSNCNIPAKDKSIEIIPTGIAEAGFFRCSVFPNPSDNAVNLSFETSGAPNATITILNPLGAVTYSATVHSNSNAFRLSFDKEQFGAAGIYSIVIKTEKGIIIKKTIITN